MFLGVLLKDPKTLVTDDILQQLPRICLRQLLADLLLLRPGHAGMSGPPVLIVTEKWPHLLTGMASVIFIWRPAGTNLVPLLLLKETPELTPETPSLRFTRYLWELTPKQLRQQ